MKSILVTGGAGFIGFNLCKYLLEKGERVIAVDNFVTSNKNNIEKLKNNKNLTFIDHNIVNEFPPSVLKKLKRIDAVFHLACPTGVPNLKTLAEEMLLTCSMGTRNVLEIARKNESAFIFTSSSEVYGDPERFPQDEDYTGNVSSVGMRSPYEEGKRFSESLIMMYVRKYGLDARVVRVFNTYGPGMSDGDTRVIPVFLRKALDNKPLPVMGEGKQRRTLCYVDDLIQALILVWKKGKKGEVYNAGGDEEFEITQLAEKVIRITDSKSKIKFMERPSHDHHGRRPDLSKIKGLGWEQEYDIEKGIIETIKSLNHELNSTGVVSRSPLSEYTASLSSSPSR